MLKPILMMLGVIMANYVPVWAADQYDQITGNAERRRPEEIDQERIGASAVSSTFLR